MNIIDLISDLISVDCGTIVGSFIAIRGVYRTIRFYRNQVYVENITQERIRWITELKNIVSDLMKFKNKNDFNSTEIEEINKLLSLILFYINGLDERFLYKVILDLQNKIGNGNYNEISLYLRFIELDFIMVFKTEWEIIKKEGNNEEYNKKQERLKTRKSLLDENISPKNEYFETNYPFANEYNELEKNLEEKLKEKLKEKNL